MSTEKTMIDSMGAAVPLRHVKPYDRVRDLRVRRILTRWRAAREYLERVMIESLADLDKIAQARGEAGMDAGPKGNLQASSFDGLITVGRNVRYDIHLDERVIQARELMYGYARSLADKLGGDDGQALLVMLDETFQVNKSGSLSVSRVLSLLRKNVRAPQWQEAQRLLSESMETRRGKSYLSVEVRPDRQHDPVPIRLDIADCWPAQTAPADEVQS
jgi:hypothetical protein